MDEYDKAVQTTFEGRGRFDVFKVRSQRLKLIPIGQLVMETKNPPFERGNDRRYRFAPGYLFFAAGLVRLGMRVGNMEMGDGN